MTTKSTKAPENNGVEIKLSELMEVTKSQAAAYFMSELIAQILDHLKKTYPDKNKVPKSAKMILEIIAGAEESVSDLYTELENEYNIPEFNYGDIKITVPKSQIIKPGRPN